MKKILGILLSVLMLISLAATVSYAGNGPSEAWMPGEEGEGNYYFAYLSVIELKDDGSFVGSGGMWTIHHIYSNNEVQNEVPGAVYDKATNTLTLTNFDQPNYYFEANMMGDDFKIKVVGDCAISNFVSFGDGWGCSINVIGDGTLTVNKKLIVDCPFIFYAEGCENVTLTVGPDVSVHFYSKDGVLRADDVDENEEIIVLSREPSEALTFETTQATHEDWCSVDVINVSDGPEDFNALRLNYKDDDGTGIWVGRPTAWYDGEGGPLIKEGYSVYHFVENKELGGWIVDILVAKSLGYEFGYLDLSTEEFEEMGFTVAKNDQGNNDWFDLKAYEYFSTNLPVYTDGTNEYVSIWKWDEEAGTSFQYFYSFKPVPGVDGLMMTDRLADVNYEDLAFKVTQTPIEGTYTKKVANKELHIGKDSELKPTVTFKDVPADAYYADAVAWAVRNNITTGTDKTHFSPNAGCTRGQVVTFLWRAAGEPEPTSAKNPFVDVKSDAYYYKAVLWAVEKGITNGTDKTHFSPNATCTRGQIVAFLYRWNGSPKPSSANNPFADVKNGDYYLDAVLWAVGKGITTGTDKTHFSPGATCTRAQVVTFMYRGR